MAAKDAEESLRRLKEGNDRFIHSKCEIGDISEDARLRTYENGQHPFAVIVACSDSREIPEAIFSCGIGDLFVIRTAGNIVDDSTLGSIEYAASHLNCPLALILGHTHCGAVASAIAGEADGYFKKINDAVREAICGETDDFKASRLNIQHSVFSVQSAFQHDNFCMKVIGALYDLKSGKVEFLDTL